MKCKFTKSRWQICECLLIFPQALSTNRDKTHIHTWTPMKALILSLVTRHPLTVPVTGFSKETSWNMAAFCRDVCTFWHPYFSIRQMLPGFYGAASGGLPSKGMCECERMCVSSGQKVVISFNARALLLAEGTHMRILHHLPHQLLPHICQRNIKIQTRPVFSFYFGSVHVRVSLNTQQNLSKPIPSIMNSLYMQMECKQLIHNVSSRLKKNACFLWIV